MFKNQILLFFILVTSFSGQCQTTKQSDYRAPLDIPLVLAANFGELRPNHFHMGVDFKTNGVEGLKLYSIEKGFVSRVKVSPYGYGNVVYIDHPNGITSVYAHCSAFKGKLDSVVKITQEKEQNYEIEIFFVPKDIPVQKGEVFALSGNSGSSTAPHLHFELRDTKTEDALNPLAFGFDISDHKSPVISGIKVYALSSEGYQIPGKSKVVNVTKGKFGYYIGGDLLLVPSDYCSEHGGIGFAFDVVDYLDGAPNVCGLYGSSLKVGTDTLFAQKIDRVSFDHSRYVNSHKDYHEYSKTRRKFHKSFRSQHNPLCIYPCDNLGILHIKPTDSLQITFDAYDPKANSSQVNFKLKVASGAINTTLNNFPSWKYLHPDSTYHFQGDQVSFTTQRHTFYEPTVKNISLKGVYTFGDPIQPIQYPVIVKMKLPESVIERSKYYVSVITSGGKRHALPTSIEGDWVAAKSKYLGTFQLKVDTIAPSIAPLNFTGNEATITKLRLTWRVSEAQTDLVDYDLFIDGKWYLLGYESKGSYLFFDRPKSLTGKHKIEVIVKDSCGNNRSWSKDVVFP